MLSKLRAIMAGVVAIGVCAGYAQASDVEREMQQMQDMVMQMQDQLEEQQRRIDEQSDQMRSAGIEDEREASSGLSNFLTQTDFGGWLAVNYTWNAGGNGNNHLLDQNSNTLSHRDSNSFKVDQLWFVMDKDVSAESRAGFHADIAFGEVANYGGFNTGNGNDAVTVYSAYLSYLIPLLPDGIRLDFGEMWTMLGAEVVQAPDNLNITRGRVWGLQPVSNTGVLLSTSLGPVDMAFGVMNDVTSGTSRDTDNNKAITAKLGWSSDMFSATAAMIWGSKFNSNEYNPGFESCVDGVGQAVFDDGGDGVCRDSGKADLGILDVLLTADPIENLTMYVDYTMQWQTPHNRPDLNGYTHGLALAGRYGITDNFGVALRGEFIMDDRDIFSDLDVGYSITGTLDYSMTDNLVGRFEVRWDKNDFTNISNNEFYKAGDRNDSPSNDDQLLLVVEMIYTF